MMAVLMDKNSQQNLIPHLEVASNFWTRGKGLLGRSHLNEDQALWIHQCNSIHTFFMKFSIDCVFVDKNLCVKAIRTDVRPGRMVMPVWGASSVIEMRSGTAAKLNIKVGDQLHVGA
jgi:Uncharacterized conserved protein